MKRNKALEALILLMSTAPLEDFVYTVKDHEGKSWDGPLVKAWSDGVKLANEAVKEAGIRIKDRWRANEGD